MRDRTLPVRPELERVLGRELTADVLRCLTHAETLDTSGTGEAAGTRRNGTAKAKRYTARAVYLPHPVRSEEDVCVRRACVLFLLILERMRPTDGGKARALSKALWIGRLKGRREGRWGLADQVGVSVRQLEHYLVLLSPIVHRWQPPASKVGPRYTGRVSGHAYGTYELTREMPREAKVALGGSWVRPPKPERAPHDVPHDVAARARTTHVSPAIAALVPSEPPTAPMPPTAPAARDGPRTGPPGAADRFAHLIPT